jgi:hypothetical protein
MLPPRGCRSEQCRSTLVNGATVQMDGVLLEDGELAAVRQSVVEERGEGDPFAAPRLGQQVFGEAFSHRFTPHLRRTTLLRCRACSRDRDTTKP